MFNDAAESGGGKVGREGGQTTEGKHFYTAALLYGDRKHHKVTDRLNGILDFTHPPLP